MTKKNEYIIYVLDRIQKIKEETNKLKEISLKKNNELKATEEERQLQRDISAFVSREVHMRANELVELLITTERIYEYSDCMPVSYKQTTCIDRNGDFDLPGDICDSCDSNVEECDCVICSCDPCEAHYDLDAYLDSKDYCEECGIYGDTSACENTDESEVFEYWFVSKYLHDDLMAKSEVVFETQDGWIWGRTTTGQAIYMDHVIREIYTGLGK